MTVAASTLVGRLPIVMLLDLDGTLIGKVSTMIAEFDLHKQTIMASGGTEAAAHSASARTLRESFKVRLLNGLLRPGIRRFLRKVEDMHADTRTAPVELFIYTASDDKWAKIIMSCVEAAAGFSFNRPLFFRSNCIKVDGPTGIPELRKSIVHLLPKLYKSLRTRYPLLLSQRDLASRVVLVDNTPGIMAVPEENARLVVCPTYNYVQMYDVLAKLDATTMLSRAALVAAILSRHGMVASFTPQMSAIQIIASYYLWLSRNLASSNADNEITMRRDTFWTSMRELIPAIAKQSPTQLISPHTVEAIQAHIGRKPSHQ